jgi:hypothetical protein
MTPTNKLRKNQFPTEPNAIGQHDRVNTVTAWNECTFKHRLERLMQASCDGDNLIIGFYNLGDRVKFWGKNGAFWGGIWSLFFGGVFLTIPVLGSVMVLGQMATW